MNTARTLIGNSFPLSLVRRRVVITPDSVETLRSRLNVSPPASFWGHASTLPHASRLLGADLKPNAERPALTLDPAGLPQLDRESYDECWVLSPSYDAGFRPAPNADVPADRIVGWQVLRMSWKE